MMTKQVVKITTSEAGKCIDMYHNVQDRSVFLISPLSRVFSVRMTFFQNSDHV